MAAREAVGLEVERVSWDKTKGPALPRCYSRDTETARKGGGLAGPEKSWENGGRDTV